MSRFVRRLTAFLLLQLAVLGALVALADRYPLQERSYLSVWGDKDRRLARPGPPRILLVGGSNLPFGFRSSLLQESAGRPVLNLGLHFGLGRDLMLRQVEENVRAGDIVVLSLEHVHLFQRFRPALVRLLAVQPRAARYLGPADVAFVLDEGLSALSSLARHPSRVASFDEVPDTSYWQQFFDKNGDNTRPRPRTAKGGKGGRRGVFTIDDGQIFAGFSDAALEEGIDRLNRFAAHCRSRGAQAVYSFPPIPDSYGTREGAVLSTIGNRLEQRLEMPLLDDPFEQLLPEADFYDSGYHLTDDASLRRSQRMAERLTPYLKASSTRLAATEP
jgi:hypothetical protein